ncbi:O-antigen ligase family protein [Bradyrhizobium daqingense]|uniref:O-antigen ligase n=1 Tax=Bradyrhizobium daqingense TaxID=993502 RepID=A0A562KTY1_9BRAD|nr:MULTISPECIES: O-antigen ligase family protein [Bradyrhizobium]MDQ8731318.1 O-antigen ligase family protein [Bradyrhizobium sp. LHD-71]TWH98814.1 O-antigen ligase [Bradyrhizobium daqingense]UFS87845.1 O-antigen ligase family protein [Bradyrhizobium daqingense]
MGSILSVLTARQRFEAFRTSRYWFVAADVLAALLSATLPWSTSGFLILLIPLLAIVLGSADVPLFTRSFRRPASLFPLAFLALAVVGISWSEAGMSDGVRGLSPMVKLLLFPFLFYYFQKSERAHWILVAFLVSCTVLLLYSWLVVFQPTLALKTGRCCGEDYGVPVRNYIDQSQEFAVCLVALILAALYSAERKAWKYAMLASALGVGFAANLLFVVTSRTALVCIPFMLLVVAWRHAGSKGALAMTIVGALVLAISWFSSPHLRARILSVGTQFEEYRSADIPSSVGKRLEFWRKSIGFFIEKPWIGHGTGSVRDLFEIAAVGHTGASAEIIANPHNQTLSAAVQWGLLGVLVLYGMWGAHLRMFVGSGYISDLGLVVITQNIIGSVFNSHLSDFTEGWMYVLGVAALAGIIAKRDKMEPHRADVAATAGSKSLN